MYRVFFISFFMLNTGYCNIDKDFKNAKEFIQSLGNQAQKEASRLDINAIPHSKENKDAWYSQIQNKALDLETLARADIARDSIENTLVAQGKEAHLQEKSETMNNSQQALDASMHTENNAALYYSRKEAYCQDGQCTNRKEEHTRDFAEDTSKLLAVSGVSQAVSDTKDVSGKTRVFGGYPFKCLIRPIKFLDCCSDKGWGKDLNLANCTTKDKELGQAKLEYRVHYIGEYCAKRKKIPGGSVCKKKLRTYCVFYTKIARIFREQAPFTQSVMSKNFGTAQYPDCSGFLPTELKFFDLGLINFNDPIYPFNANNPFGHAGIADAGISVDMKPKAIDKDDFIDKANQASSKDGQ